MIIYTLVSRTIPDNVKLIKSFTDKKKAEKFADEYDGFLTIQETVLHVGDKIKQENKNKKLIMVKKLASILAKNGFDGDNINDHKAMKLYHEIKNLFVSKS